MFDFSAFAQGMAIGLGMFVCPGPKDLVVLRQALRRRPIVELLAVGIGSDALLILLGMAGISIALSDAPAARRVAMWMGVGLMLWHGLSALWRSNATVEIPSASVLETGRQDRATLLLTSFLNPVAWMDTVLVIGTAGALLPGSEQFSYGAGAVAASSMWFVALTCGARYAARWLDHPMAWRALDGFVSIVMLLLAGYVAHGLL